MKCSDAYFRKIAQRMASGNKTSSEAAIVIQATDAEVGGMGRWTHSGDAKGIQSPGPVAKLDM